MSTSDVYMITGFLLAGYAVVANDAIQTLGTFLSSNAHRPWWLLWLFVGGVLVAVMLYGYVTRDGDLSYGRLTRIPETGVFAGWMVIPPLVIPGLSRFGIRLLMLTGCRLSEIQKLRWEHVDLDAGELRLPDTKTGGRAVPLAPSAVRLLTSLPRDEDNPWVIAGRKPGSYLTDLQHPWRRIRGRAGLDDVRIHDLRHSFASRALALGEGLTMIGKLLGHTQVQTTARYAHLARDTVKASAARIGDSIDQDLDAAERL